MENIEEDNRGSGWEKVEKERRYREWIEGADR